jgi:hypothetical protein
VVYIHRRYIPWLLRQLTEEYKDIRSSVITEERILVSCNVWKSGVSMDRKVGEWKVYI